MKPSRFPDEDLTPPFGLTFGDRVVLEQKLAILESQLAGEHAWVEGLLQERQRRDVNWQTRVDRQRNLIWFALGMASASLVVQLIRIVTLLVIKGNP